MATYKATDKKVLNMLKQYEGQTIEDFMYSDLVDLIGLDIIKIDGQEIKYGEEYDDSKDGAVIRYVEVRNVNGYIIADIATEDF